MSGKSTLREMIECLIVDCNKIDDLEESVEFATSALNLTEGHFAGKATGKEDCFNEFSSMADAMKCKIISTRNLHDTKLAQKYYQTLAKVYHCLNKPNDEKECYHLANSFST